ncbi:MAG: cupin domain-containing protein [Candidatus Peregrinibacteria bacterium]
MISKKIIKEKIEEIAGRPWFPVEVATVNDQVVRLALFEGEYHWHQHDDEDELFFVYSGQITIQLKNQPNIILNSGEIAVVPKGIEHCPKSTGSSYVLMFEPQETKSKGNY